MSFSQNVTLTGMTFVDIAVPAAGAYNVSGKIQLPRIASGGGQSSVVATVGNLTGPVLLYTGTAGADGFYVAFNAAAGDFIRVSLTSGDADDTPANAVKCEISLSSGQ